MIVVKIKTI